MATLRLARQSTLTLRAALDTAADPPALTGTGFGTLVAGYRNIIRRAQIVTVTDERV